jgi:hypothetical protein
MRAYGEVEEKLHNYDTPCRYLSDPPGHRYSFNTRLCGKSGCGDEEKSHSFCWESNPRAAFSITFCSSCAVLYGQIVTHFDPCALILLIGLTRFLLTLSSVTTVKPSQKPSEHFSATNNRPTADYGFRSQQPSEVIRPE